MRNEGVFFILTQLSPMGQCLLIQEITGSHTTTHHSQLDSSGRVINWQVKGLIFTNPLRKMPDGYALHYRALS